MKHIRRFLRDLRMAFDAGRLEFRRRRWIAKRNREVFESELF